MSECICTKCRTETRIEGDFPKYFAWCSECDDYAQGFDSTEYVADIYANQLDQSKEKIKYRNLNQLVQDFENK